ncbi:MAG: hypothetical protein QHH10_00560 [Peptococcaceae bacterium]|nr:hypothetical protein [Peptococcaceae bacterium]MDH7523792.1 hypothetical protein [Peptococcaceae bacterium]
MIKRWLVLILVLCLVLPPAPLLGAPVLVTLTINENIVPGPDDVRLTATGTYSDGSTALLTTGLAWFSSNHEIAEFYGNTLHFKGKGGSLTISVYKDGVTGIKTLTVKPWPVSIDIETTLVESANPYRLMLKAVLSDGGSRYLGPDDNVIWSTSNPWVAWVNSQGVVTFTGEEGYVSITAAVGSLTDSVNTTATGDGGSTTWRKGIKIKEDLKYSSAPQKLTLVAVMADDTEEELENSAADWSSSNKEVASVSSDGVLTFTGKPGFTTIRVSYGGYHYEKVVSVGRFLTGLSINQSLNYTDSWAGKPLLLSATARYNDGSEYSQSSGLTWSVDNKKVAAISADGALTFTGESGKATVSVKGKSNEDTYVEDSLSVEVPAAGKAVPLRFFIDVNPVGGGEPQEVKAFCVYSDGSLRDVTERAFWISGTPDTASIYEGKIYFSPLPGPIRISAYYQGLSDQVTGYNQKLTGNSQRIYQLRLKQHGLAFDYRPVQLTALALTGDGKLKDVTSSVVWRTSQPLVAAVEKGRLKYTGRTGKAVISVQGYGFRDELNIEVSPAELQPQVEKLELEGELKSGAQQLKALARFNDGTVKDVTKEAVWNTSNRNVAVVSEGMVMFPGSLKPVIITASYKGREAQVERK